MKEGEQTLPTEVTGETSGDQELSSEKEVVNEFTPTEFLNWAGEQGGTGWHDGMKYIVKLENIRIEFDDEGKGSVDGGAFNLKEVDPDNPMQSILGMRG